MNYFDMEEDVITSEEWEEACELEPSDLEELEYYLDSEE